MKSDHCPATGAIQELYRCSIKLIEAASSRRGCIEPSRLPFASSFMRRIIVTPTGDVEASSLCIEASSLYIEEHRGASSLYVEASRPGLWLPLEPCLRDVACERTCGDAATSHTCLCVSTQAILWWTRFWWTRFWCCHTKTNVRKREGFASVTCTHARVVCTHFTRTMVV